MKAIPYFRRALKIIILLSRSHAKPLDHTFRWTYLQYLLRRRQFCERMTMHMIDEKCVVVTDDVIALWALQQ